VGKRQDNPKKSKHQFNCQRCGECCRNVGSTFYASSEHPLIKRIGKDITEFKDKGKCSMLRIATSGQATCLIEKYLCRAAKPEVCRNYPFDNEKCSREKNRKPY
jgi:Fe-S-cluster containining protein